MGEHRLNASAPGDEPASVTGRPDSPVPERVGLLRAPLLRGREPPRTGAAVVTRIRSTPSASARRSDGSSYGAGLLDHLTTAVLVLERGSVIERMNSAAEALLDTSMQAARGVPLSELVAEGELLDAVDRVLDTTAPLTERALPITLDTGQTRLVDCTLTPIITAQRAPGILVELVQLDRRNQITREERLLTQTAYARNLVRRLGHEIKNPLGGLRGAAQLLESELPDAALREYTGVIIREADRLTNLVQRMIGPRHPLRMEPVNVHEVTERVRALVRAEAPSSIVVERDYDPSIPDLAADPELLIQAMLNIARNAVHVLGDGGRVVLRTRVQRGVSIGARHHRLACRIDVSDDGPGIPDDLVDSMFYPLVSGRDGGAGLGLSIAQSLVYEHGGIIECTSRPGDTTFSLLLPMDATGRSRRA